ncbi:MAG: hypothetical protein IJM44_03625 [Ruminococcus sp.]|nr:hypothetical protein [Ruminococcus sp.]
MQNKEQCVIQCKQKKQRDCGFTKVIISPDKHMKLVFASSITGKTIQDITDELLEFALSHAKIEMDGGKYIPLGKQEV